MQELDTPLRLSWSLSADGDTLDAAALLKVAHHIGEAGVMFVSLHGDPLRHPSIDELLECLAEHGCQVTLVVPDAHRLRADLPIHALALDLAPWFRADCLDEQGLAACLEQVRDKGFELLLWLAVMKQHLFEITTVLEFCRRIGVAKIKLSNLPIDANFGRIDAGVVPRPADLQQVEKTLRRAVSELQGTVALEVHDRFLWELLADGDAKLSEYGGCQAANSLAHVDALGQVHPCSSWLLPLGDLCTTSFEEIWAAPLRQQVRDDINAVPEGCVGCRDYHECFAGCRGLSACFDFANQGRDPLCAGRR
ncbi:MAG: hypothetical protein C0624_05770 [Desulfuromonas sp.]|nr:MAG: hypothetical protein C0624_05770 [Desulfuromonas sp.]